MQLLLFRHGIAIERDDPACPIEAERFLTETGIKRTKKSARGLARLGLAPELILTSPFVRAKQTAAIARRALGIDEGVVHETDALLWDAPPQPLWSVLETHSGAGCILCCGHAPHLDRFIADALRARRMTRLKKAGLAILEIDPAGGHKATLDGLYSPRVLRHLGSL